METNPVAPLRWSPDLRLPVLHVVKVEINRADRAVSLPPRSLPLCLSVCFSLIQLQFLSDHRG